METFEFNVVFNKIRKRFVFDITNTNTIHFLKELIKTKYDIKDDISLLVKAPTEKILTEKLFNDTKDKCNNLEVEVLLKAKGGIGIAMFAVIVFPIIVIGIAFAAAGDVVNDFIDLLISTFEIIPLIFDPPKLIDDVLFAITSSISIVFGRFGGDMKNLASSPEDDTQEQGPFGVSNANRNAFTCMDPSWSTIALLVICPPLAIIYKLGAAGLISSIICGVLCVKLYYFPGLLFAILHVLC
jgi:hypothetical protein